MKSIKEGISSLFKGSPAAAAQASASSKISQASASSKISNIQFATSPCTTCQDPCEVHENMPMTMMKRIDTSNLYNTFKPYRYHFLVQQGSPKSWPEHVEKEESSIAKAFSDRLEAMGAKDKESRSLLTLYQDDQCDDSPLNVIVFPSAKVYQNVSLADVEQLIQIVTSESDDTLQDLKLKEKLVEKKAFVLICSHGKRDKKCGVAGPLLVEEFKKVLSIQGLEDQVPVVSVSHIGGHKFAGNIILYQKDERDLWIGDWYGRIRTCHVESIVQECIKDGKVFQDLWRGRFNGDPADPHLDNLNW